MIAKRLWEGHMNKPYFSLQTPCGDIIIEDDRGNRIPFGIERNGFDCSYDIMNGIAPQRPVRESPNGFPPIRKSRAIRPGQTICFPPSEKNGRKSCFRRLRPHSSRLLRLARHPQRFPLWISCTSGLSTSTSLLPDG